MHKYLIATSTIAALLAASPAFADSHGSNHFGFFDNVTDVVKSMHADVSTDTDENQGDDDTGLGAQVRVRAHENDDIQGGIGSIVSEFAHAFHPDVDKDRDADEGHHATTANTTVRIVGTVTAMNGTTLTISGKNGATYTVNAAHVVVNHVNVGDTVEVKGTLASGIIDATSIAEKLNPVAPILTSIDSIRGGLVTALTGTGFMLSGGTSVNTNASTTFAVGGHATTSSAVATGTNVLAFGTTSSSTPNTITAQLVVVLGQGLEFLRDLFLAR